MSELVERVRYAYEYGSADQLHRELADEIERLHELIRRGLAYGDQFRSPYAAGARAELRSAAGMKPNRT